MELKNTPSKTARPTVEQQFQMKLAAWKRPTNPNNLLNKNAQNTNSNIIVDVWANNLHEEIGKIMEIVEDYPYIAMVRAASVAGKCFPVFLSSFERNIQICMAYRSCSL